MYETLANAGSQGMVESHWAYYIQSYPTLQKIIFTTRTHDHDHTAAILPLCQSSPSKVISN